MDGGVAQLVSLEECVGWANEMKGRRHEEVEGERFHRALGVVVVVVVHGDDHEIREQGHDVHEEDHVFYRDEPKGPRIPDRPRKD